jgi:hypothetical protein
MSKAPNKGWIGQAIASGAIKATAYHITVIYVLPIGIPLITGLIGYLSNTPWFWIWLGVLAAFAFVSNGLLSFGQWLDRRSVKDKLIFGSVRFVQNINGPGNALGVWLNSKAAVPIELNVREVRTRLNNRVPSNRAFEKTDFVVSPFGYVFFDDHIIDFGDPPKPGTIEGFLEIIIDYGYPGSLNHELVVKKRVLAAFNDEGRFTHLAWNDIA